jgi:hypothetical protein
MTSKQVMARLRVCFIEERSCITSKLTGAAIMNNLESKEQVNEHAPRAPVLGEIRNVDGKFTVKTSGRFETMVFCPVESVISNESV